MSWGDVSVELTTETESEMIDGGGAATTRGIRSASRSRCRSARSASASCTSSRKKGDEDERHLPDGDEPGVPRGARRRDVREHLRGPRPRHGLRRAPGDRVDARRSSIARGSTSKIIVGSMRHMMDVNEALEAGAHVPTVTPPILRKMVWNPRTIETINEFNTRLAQPAEEEVTEQVGAKTGSPDWTDKHVLVTGGAGFIGSHVIDALLARGARVTVFDNFSTGFREFVAPSRDRLRIVEGDLLDQSRRRRGDARGGLRVPPRRERRHQGQPRAAAQVHRPEHRRRRRTCSRRCAPRASATSRSRRPARSTARRR